jgi:uncharacterized membrane protein
MFDRILDFIKNEPVAVGTAVIALIQAVFGVLIAFNLPITPEQQTSIIALVSAVIGMTVLVATVIRSNATPVANPKDNDGTKLVPEIKEINELNVL